MAIAEETTTDTPMVVNRTIIISKSHLCFSSRLRDAELTASDQQFF